MSLSPSTGIHYFTYSDFKNNAIYNIGDIWGVTNVYGPGIIQGARGTFNYMQVSGGTGLRTEAPVTAGVFIGKSSSSSYGIEMAASGDTSVDFTTPGTNTDYKGRIQYDNTLNALNLYANSAALPTLTIDGSSLTVNRINTNVVRSNQFYISSADGTSNTAVFDTNLRIFSLKILHLWGLLSVSLKHCKAMPLTMI